MINNNYDKEIIDIFNEQYSILTGKLVYYAESILDKEGINITFNNIVDLVKIIINTKRHSEDNTILGLNIDLCPINLEYIITEDCRIDLSDNTQQELIDLIVLNKEKAYYKTIRKQMV